MWPLTSKYAHPVLFVKKKDGEMCMCIDCCTLNANICVDLYPIPHINDLLHRLHHVHMFSKSDLYAGYH